MRKNGSSCLRSHGRTCDGENYDPKQELLLKMAEIIRLLDETAKANAIKGVAGMRSYFIGQIPISKDKIYSSRFIQKFCINYPLIQMNWQFLNKLCLTVDCYWNFRTY